MLPRPVDPENRSPLPGIVACLVAAAVSAYVGHFGIALLAVVFGALAIRRAAAPGSLRRLLAGRVRVLHLSR